MRKREIGAFIGGFAGNAVFFFGGYVIMVIPIWLAWIGFIISTGLLVYGVYLFFSPISKTLVSSDSDTEIKQKTLKKVFGHVKCDKERIFILIENKEWKIDIICSHIIVYEVNHLKESITFDEIDRQHLLNSLHKFNAEILSSSPFTKVNDVFTFIEHRKSKKIDFLTINPLENKLKFETLYKREPLDSGSYNIALGFSIDPQKEGYEKFEIYLTLEINYRGDSDLEILELRNARTRV